MSRITILSAALALAIAPSALAKDTTVNVQFDKGKHSKEISSSIKGDAGVNYMLQVSAGQVMQVLFSTSQGSCYFNVYEPGANEAVFNGSITGNEYGASPTKAGAYKIQVYQMRATARRNETCKYSISFEVTGAGHSATPAAAHSDVPEVAKGACLYQIGAEADIVQVSALKPGFWEIIMQEKASKRKVACTVDAEGNIQDWVEMK